MARKTWKWEYHLTQVLSTKPAEVVQKAYLVLEKHGYSVKMLKSELYYSSTLCQVVFSLLHYANLIVTHAPTAWTTTQTHTFLFTRRHNTLSPVYHRATNVVLGLGEFHILTVHSYIGLST